MGPMVEAGKVGGGAGEPPKAASGAPSVSNAPKPSPLAAALREVERSLESVASPGSEASEPEGEALARARRMRADLATRKASLLISGLMQTPDCALDVFREGREVDPALDVRRLKQLRDVLDALHAIITANDPARWNEVESVWGLLGHGEHRAGEAAVEGPVEARPSPAETLPELPPAPRSAVIAAGPLSTAPTVRGDLLSPWRASPAAPAPPATPPVPSAPAAPSMPVAPAPPVSISPAPAPPPSLAPPTVPRAAGPPRPSVLDQTAEASYSTDDRTSLHAVPSRAEAALPFRSRPPAEAASSEPSLLGPDVPMDGGEGTDGETRRIRLHVLPFKPKPVPFEPTSSQDRTALHPTAGAAPSAQAAPLPFVPAKAPAPASPSGGTTRSWEGEERTALIDCEPPPEEPTTRSEASFLMSTMEVETRRTPMAGVAPPPAPSPAAANPAPPTAEASAEPPTSLLDLEGYAAYRAEISLRPDDVATIRQRYKLHGAASYERLDAYWQNRLASDPALRQRWQALCQRYAAWMLLKQKK